MLCIVHVWHLLFRILHFIIINSYAPTKNYEPWFIINWCVDNPKLMVSNMAFGISQTFLIDYTKLSMCRMQISAMCMMRYKRDRKDHPERLQLKCWTFVEYNRKSWYIFGVSASVQLQTIMNTLATYVFKMIHTNNKYWNKFVRPLTYIHCRAQRWAFILLCFGWPERLFLSGTIHAALEFPLLLYKPNSFDTTKYWTDDADVYDIKQFHFLHAGGGSPEEVVDKKSNSLVLSCTC